MPRISLSLLTLILALFFIIHAEWTENSRTRRADVMDENSPKFSEMSTALNQLLSNYDRRLRPSIGTGIPDRVNASILVSAAEFNPSKGELKAVVDLTLNWFDNRLQIEVEEENVTLQGGRYADQIWKPGVEIKSSPSN